MTTCQPPNKGQKPISPHLRLAREDQFKNKYEREREREREIPIL